MIKYVINNFDVVSFNFLKVIAYMSLDGIIISMIILLLKKLLRNNINPLCHYLLLTILLAKLIIPFSIHTNYNVFNIFNNFYTSSTNINKINDYHLSSRKPMKPNDNLLAQNIKQKADVKAINSGYANNNSLLKIYDKLKERSTNNVYFLGLIWFLGAATIIIFTAISNVVFRHKLQLKHTMVNNDITFLLEECKNKLNIKKSVKVIFVDEKRVPFLIGVLKPTIVLPVMIIDSLSQEEIKYILLHELMHYKHKDLLFNWVTLIVQAIHWFNPVLWYSFNKIREDSEIMCDLSVLNSIDKADRINYGNTIVNLADIFLSPAVVAITAGSVKKSNLKRRVIMISKPEKSSVKRLTTSVIAVAIIGALSLTDVISANSTNSANTVLQNQIISKFNTFYTSGNSADAAKYLDTNISKVTKESASAMLSKFEEIQKKDIVNLEKRIDNDGNLQSKLSKISIQNIYSDNLSAFSDVALRKVISDVRSGGYKITTSEGMYFPVVDYRFYSKYKNFVTNDMKDYIDLMTVESDRTPAEDNGLVISWGDVITRALNQEKFIKSYSNSIKISKVKNLYSQYLTYVLYGLNNTPLFNYDTNVMVTEAKSAYLNAITKATAAKDINSNSSTIKLLQSFMNVLKQNNYKLNSKVEDFRKSNIKKAY